MRRSLTAVFVLTLSVMLAGCTSDGTLPAGTASATSDGPTATSSADTEAPDKTAPATMLVIDDPDAATCWFHVGVEASTGEVVMTDDDMYVCFFGSTFSGIWPLEGDGDQHQEGTWKAGGDGTYTLATDSATASARIDGESLYVELTPGTEATRADVFALYGLCQDPEACLADPTWQVGRD